MNCPVHRARDYVLLIMVALCNRADHYIFIFFSLHNYFSFIIVSVCVAFIFHLIITKFMLHTHCSTTRFTE